MPSRWLCGAASFITGRVTKPGIYRQVQDNRINVVYATPTLYRILADDEQTTPRL